MTALLDRTIGSLRHRLAAETERNLTLSMHMPHARLLAPHTFVEDGRPSDRTSPRT